MFQQRLIYLTTSHLSLYDWLGDRLTGCQRFTNGSDGITSLTKIFENNPSIPTYILIDVLEEQYLLGTVPHTRWGDRSAMCSRYSARSFRGTPFRYATFQGREDSGRRDDRILGVGITNPDLIMPLINALKEKLVAIKGVASLPIATQDLLRLLPHRSNHILLVTHLASGLRLSFYENRRLKLSRLTSVRDVDEEQRVNIVCDEIDKTERYLGRMRLLDGKVNISVVIMCDPASYPFYIMKSLDERNSRFAVINSMDLLRKIPLIEDPSPLVNQVIAHIFLGQMRSNHYADSSLLRTSTLYSRVKQLRIAGGMIAALGVGAAGLAVFDASELSQEASAHAARTVILSAQAAEIEGKLPATPMPPPQIRSAVQVVDELKHWRRTPTPLLLTLGQTLKQFSDVHLTAIAWHTLFPDEIAATFDPSAPVPVNSEGSPTGESIIREVATVEGQLFPFNGNLIQAIARIDALMASLRLHTGVKKVTLVKSPVAVSSSERSEGEIGGQEHEHNAEFSISVTVERQRAQSS